MKVRFNIDYSTVYGENLVLNIVDNADAEKISRHVMKSASDKAWKCDLDLPAKAGQISYSRVDGDYPSLGPERCQSHKIYHL